MDGGQVIEFHPQPEAETLSDEQADAIALEALIIATNEEMRQERHAHRAELLAIDYQPAKQPIPEHEVVKRNGKVIFPPKLATKEEKSEAVDELLVNGAALEGFRLNDGQKFILTNIISGDPKRFTRKDVFKTLYGEHKSESARSQAFVADILKVMDILEKIAGQPIVVRHGKRGGAYYEQLMAVRAELDDVMKDSQEGEVDLKRTDTETVAEIKRRKSAPTSSMTSEEFWKSPIEKPKLSMRSKLVARQAKPSTLPPPTVLETRSETRDGREWTVKVLEGYTGQAPRPTVRRVRTRHQKTINSSLGID